MRKYINIINEGIDPRSNHPAFAPDGDDTIADKPEGEGMDDFEKMFADIFAPLHNLKNRMSIEDVYHLCIDGIPFEDAVGHIAKRDDLDAAQLRGLVIDDYKMLRGNAETYASPMGHTLVGTMNPQIRESLDEAVILHEASLMERGPSMKVGAYTNAQGGRLIVLRAEHDPKHHMVMNQKGEVMASHHGDPQELHDKLTADGFQGAITDIK